VERLVDRPLRILVNSSESTPTIKISPYDFPALKVERVTFMNEVINALSENDFQTFFLQVLNKFIQCPMVRDEPFGKLVFLSKIGETLSIMKVYKLYREGCRQGQIASAPHSSDEVFSLWMF